MESPSRSSVSWSQNRLIQIWNPSNTPHTNTNILTRCLFRASADLESEQRRSQTRVRTIDFSQNKRRIGSKSPDLERLNG
ncbi:hypothetical protein HanIR_Chr13g0619261 [Helianthus annuus]|nr:hypothetical protein HanIR_Chr13g0619261 [Helianthus annuus]